MRYISIFLCFIFLHLIACSYQTTAKNKENASKNNVTIYKYQGSAKEMAHQFGLAEKKRFMQIYEMIIKANRLENREEMIFKMAYAREKYIDKESKEEIQAFAKAAQVPYKKVLVVNCFYDLFRAGCRQVVAWGKKTEDGRLLHARNLDWKDWGTALRNNNILLTRKYKDRTIVTLTWPGFFGCSTGCNDKGIVIAYNLLHGTSNIAGEPIFLILKRVLRQAQDINSALNIIKKSTFCTDGSVMISSSTEKKALVVNIVGGKLLVRKAHPDLFITNNNNCYFRNNKLSRNRYQKCGVYQTTESMSHLSVQKMQKILAHPRVMLDLNMLSAIFDLSNNKLYLSCGRYKAAKGPYKEIDLFQSK